MADEVRVVYLGGPTIILEIGGLRIMTDPTLDPAGTEFPDKEKPLYWKTEGPAKLDLGQIDVVLLSHDQHGDNLDHAGRDLLRKVPQTFTTRDGAERLGGNARDISPWESIRLNDEVTI